MNTKGLEHDGIQILNVGIGRDTRMSFQKNWKLNIGIKNEK